MDYSFGLSVLGVEFLDILVNKTDTSYIDTTSENTNVYNYIKSKNRECLLISKSKQRHIKDDFMYENLREYDVKATKSLKKKFKYQTVIVNWPNKNSNEVEMIERLKPEFLCVIIDSDGVCGSKNFHSFLNEQTDIFPHGGVKYKTIFKVQRLCIEFKTGKTCNVMGIILSRNEIKTPMHFENYNPFVLFSRRV